MSKNFDGTPRRPKTEVWLVIMALAFVPVIGAMFMPEPTRMPLLVTSAVLFIVGFALMIRQSRLSRGGESLRSLVHSDSD